MTNSNGSGDVENRRDHRRIFCKYNPPDPWVCYFECGKLVYDEEVELFRDRFIVHHIDGDKSNNDPSNLVAAHWGCHSQYHRRLDLADPTTRAKLLSNLDGTGRKSPNKGKSLPASVCAKISASKMGHETSPETRQKIGDAQRDQKRKPHSTAAIEKMRVAAKLRGMPPETIAKAREANLGRKHSAETLAKMSEAKKGERNPFYGKTHTPETLEKMRGARNPMYGKILPSVTCPFCGKECRGNVGLSTHQRFCKSMIQ